ncbi:MAG: FAD/NAD(P)-binding oxidoreductase [Chloroflexota bacterium]
MAGTDAPFDIAVIGAGPAGLAAAVAAVGAGARVALVDASVRPGGQYWRHRPADDGALHHDWATFSALRDGVEAGVRAGGLVHLTGHGVWHLERAADGFTVHAVANDHDVEIRVERVVIATGAYDRQLPFPGWTLPGVFTAGGVQALLKGQGVVAGKRIVVAGTGPFLLPVAAGLVHAGAEVAGVLEAGRPTAFLRHPMTAARAIDKLVEGAGYMATLLRHRVPYQTRRTVIEAHGQDEVDGVTTAALDADWRIVPGTKERIECDTVAVGYGFTPQVELAVDLGCEMTLDIDGSLVVTADATQRSSVDGAWVAGEVCGVGGSALAVVEGRIAGLHAAAAVTGAPPSSGELSAAVARRARLREFAALLPVAYPVRPGWRTWITGATTICRCEEVRADTLREAVTDLGATDARSAKLFSRAGMGLCQGRVCGYATAGLVADACGRDVTADDLASTVRRPIAAPITLGALAAGAINPTAPSTPLSQAPDQEASA